MPSRPWPILLTVRRLDQGGCERDLTRVAAHIDRSRFEPHVGCFYREGVRFDDLTAAGIPVAEFPFRGFKSASSIYPTIREFRAYIRRHGIRLIHTYDGPTTMFLLPLAEYERLPVIISSQLSLRELNARWEQRLLQFTDRFVDKLVVNSKAVLEDMANQYSTPRSKLALVYNGVDTRLYHPGPKVRPPGLEDASIVLGSIAALREEKQLHLLIEAFARIRSMRPGTRLLMVGSGYDEPRLRSRAAELGVMNDVVWAPTQRDVTGWMRAVDIFVLPSRSESFPNGLLEAMASGCCPVGSDVGGIPELIEHGKSGFLFPSGDSGALADCLASLISNDELRLQFARAAVERAHSVFTLDKFVANTANLYESLLTERLDISASPATVHL